MLTIISVVFTITDNEQETSMSLVSISYWMVISFGVNFAYYVIEAVQSRVE